VYELGEEVRLLAVRLQVHVGGEPDPAPSHPTSQAAHRSRAAAFAEKETALPLPVSSLLAILCRAAQPGEAHPGHACGQEESGKEVV